MCDPIPITLLKIIVNPVENAIQRHVPINQVKHTNLQTVRLNPTASQPQGGGGRALPYKRPMGMCRWMGSLFHDWSDYNRVAFSKELLEWGRAISEFLG